MSVLINFKICDNAKECGGIVECPTGAIFWNEDESRIELNSEKCKKCGACVDACPISAIHVASNEDEYKKIQQEIDNDPRTTDDLFVDRYGAVPIDDSILLYSNELTLQVEGSKGITLVEFFDDSSIQCLLNSIPVKEIIDEISGCVAYKKVEVNSDLCAKYEVKELPTLLVFKDGKLTGKISGVFETQQQADFVSSIMQFKF